MKKIKKYSAELTERLRYLVNTELDKIKSDIILKKANGYVLFDKYKLISNDSRYVLFNNDEEIATFYDTPAAVAYCLALYKHNKILAQQILTLDSTLHYRIAEHELYTYRLNNDNVTQVEVLYVRQSDNYEKLKCSKQEMLKLIDLAKYYYS